MPEKFVIQHELSDTAITRFHYVVDFINAHPLKPVNFLLIVDNQSSDKDLFYGNNGGPFFTVPLDACFLENTKTFDHFYPAPFSHSNVDFFAVNHQKINGAQFIQNNHFGFDIFNTLFFHISRYEEYFALSPKNGQTGWLAEDHHFLIKNNLHKYPVVDHLLAAFFEIISQKKIEKKSTYAISHDVDILNRFTPSYKFLRSLGASLLIHRSGSQFKNNVAHYAKMISGKVKDPYDYFSTLLRREKMWEDKQIFMMAGGKTQYDNKYRITDSAAKKVMKMADEAGYTVGLHPSYNAGFKSDLFTKEQKKLTSVSQQYIVDNRQHWLRWDWRITPYLFSKNGISTDSSMGYSRYLGFRCGTGFPYRMYNFKEENAFDWVEYPMALMDSSAIHQAQRTGGDLTELLRSFLLLNKKNTHLTLNFHNSNFDPLLKTGRQLRYFYEKELAQICFY